MARFAIICEYNPLHRGHAYHLQKARELGADEIVCIMSGNFTQRAEPAMAHKYTRARAAVLCGADLVVELPFVHAASSAEFFACAGVAAADALGADVLFFGSECNDVNRLTEHAKIANSEKFKQIYQDLIKTNIGTAAAYARAFEQVSGQPFSTLSNDLLGLSYCKAILSGGYDITPVCIAREGSAYTQTKLSDTFSSATALRALASEKCLQELRFHIPQQSYDALLSAQQAGELFGNGSAYSAALLSLLRATPTERITNAALCSGGLGERIASAAQQATNIALLYELVAHKSLPVSHVRRAVLYAALGITEQDLRRTPEYLGVLAANARGRAILSSLRHTCPVPLITKPADAPDCAQRALTDRADALYTLGMQMPQSAAFFKRQSPFMDIK